MRLLIAFYTLVAIGFAISAVVQDETLPDRLKPYRVTRFLVCFCLGLIWPLFLGSLIAKTK